MKLSAEDKVKHSARQIVKKHKILLPLVYVVSFLILLIVKIVEYFKSNGKRYIVILTALVFFFMSSSFAFPGEGSDESIYLASEEGGEEETASDLEEISEEETPLSSDAAWIEDSEITSPELEKELSKTDNIDTFTLEDFLAKEKDGENKETDDGESAFDKDAWNLILVNKTHPVPEDYDVPLTTLSGTMKCDERVLEPLTEMLSAAEKDGVSLIVCSPYRDYTLQEKLFNRKINAYMSRGYSYMDAYKMTCSNVTVPGASEHQIGMAFDFVTATHKTLDYDFGNTEAGKWLKAHSKEYGFILRYPADKTDITGIMFEPWHFRYVGVEAATYIMDNDLTLEEFIDSLD